jgi:hypothetical protein
MSNLETAVIFWLTCVSFAAMFTAFMMNGTENKEGV